MPQHRDGRGVRWTLVLGIVAAAAAAVMAIVPGASAQVVAPQAAVPDDAATGREPTSGVYVKDSAIAVEKRALAMRMESLKAWDKSADVYQEIIEKYHERVIPSQKDADGKVYQYRSIVLDAQERLCRWPAEGLAVYKARYEAKADGLLAGAGRGDLKTLNDVFNLYFVTDAAKQAGIRLMDERFEQGEYAAAAWVGDRLLQWHPNLDAERPSVMFRAALAHRLCGDENAAQDLLAKLQKDFPAAVGAVRGEDVNLADALGRELKNGSALVRAEANGSWTTFGGDDSRGKVMAVGCNPGAKLYSVNLQQPNWREINDVNARNQILQSDRTLRGQGAAIGVFPVIDRGELFFQDNARLYAVSIDSGVPLPGWAATYAGRNGAYAVPNGWGMPAGQQFTVTLTDNAVLAVMNLPDKLEMQGGTGFNRETRLVCLDRATGAERWTAATRQLPDGQGPLRDLQIGGSPLVVGDNVYVIGRSSKGQGFEDCYVLCYDLANGKFRWACYVASANTGPMYDPSGQTQVADAVSHLAYASGRLFVMTNLGAVAAIDAYSGAVAWLNIYRDDAQNFAGGMNGGGVFFAQQMNAGAGVTSTPPWTYNPAVVEDGKLFVLPADGKYIYIYDAGTGVEVKRILRADLAADDAPADVPTTLLGIAGDSLLACSTTTVWRIPWKAFDPVGNRQPDGFWREGVGDGSIRGRGFVAGSFVYVPTDKRLMRFTLRSGKSVDPYPTSGAWQAPQGPGNVLVSSDHVILATATSVDVYTDLDMAKRKLDLEVATAPADAAPRLRYAEVMFVAGQTDTALAKLDEAINLLGGLSNLRPGPDRSRAFNDALTFATKLSAAPDAADQADKLFDRAAAAADSASQQVSYRSARAKFALSRNDYASAVRLYQEVLSDDRMRLVTMPDGDGGGQSQAGTVAEKAIAKLLQSAQGRTAYAPFEDEAAKGLGDARTGNDPDKLLAVAQQYPNSKVALDAMFAAADAYESANNPRQATLVLRRIYLKYPDRSRDQVLESLARNYLKIGGRIDAAVSRLALAERVAPDQKLRKPLPLPDGTTLADLSLKEAHDRLSKFAGKLSADSLPDLRLPTLPEYNAYKQQHVGDKAHPLAPPFVAGADVILPNVGTLLVPLQGFENNARVVTWTAAGQGLSIYPALSGAAVGAAPAITDPPRGCAWVGGGGGGGGGGNLIVWTDKTVTLIAGQDAKPLWHLDLAGLPGIEVVSDAGPDDSNAAAADDANGGGGDVIATDQNDAPVVVNNGRVRIVRRQRVIVRNGVVMRLPVGVIVPPGAMPPGFPGVPFPAAPPAAPADGDARPTGEAIQFVQPVGDRTVVATSTGRIFAVDANGAVAWQTRLCNHPLSRLVANDDFTVLLYGDASEVDMVALDSYSGQLLARKAFQVENGQFPRNLALAADGTLVYLMSDRVCVKDLFDTGASKGLDPGVQSSPTPEQAQMFATNAGADQLLVASGRIFALGDGGKFVRVYSLDTGRVWQYPSDHGDVDAILATGSQTPTVSLRISNDYLYARSSKSLIAYDVDKPELQWTLAGELPGMNVTDWLFGRDYVLLLDQPSQPLTVSNKTTGDYRLLGFARRRQPADPGESGKWTYTYPINDPAGVSTFQPMDGGIAYLAGDGKLHELKGASGKE